MQLERQPRGDGGDAGCVRADADRVVPGDHVISDTSDPMQAVAATLHNALIVANVSLPFLECDEIRNLLREAEHL